MHTYADSRSDYLYIKEALSSDTFCVLSKRENETAVYGNG